MNESVRYNNDELITEAVVNENYCGFGQLNWLPDTCKQATKEGLKLKEDQTYRVLALNKPNDRNFIFCLVKKEDGKDVWGVWEHKSETLSGSAGTFSFAIEKKFKGFVDLKKEHFGGLKNE